MIDLSRRYALPVLLAGVVILLLGLAWDAVLHALDPDLAAREGVFAPQNPGHVLFGAGIALVVLGSVMLVFARSAEAAGRRSLLVPGLGAFSLVVLAGASFGLAAASGALTNSHHIETTLHVHEDGMIHTPEEHRVFSQAAAGQSDGHDHAKAPAVTGEQLLAAARLVEEVRALAPRWEDFRVAEAEGYRMVTAGRLLHYVHPGYLLNGRTLDPEKPESLVYYRAPGGERVLVGIMFLTPSGVKGPDFGGPLSAWHAHDNLCYNAAGVVAGLTNSRGECPAGTTFRGVTGEMIHVWLFDTPAGVFAEMNEVMPYLQEYADRRAQSR
jgi:hypothetical protein